jgi:hypothetical protein
MRQKLKDTNLPGFARLSNRSTEMKPSMDSSSAFRAAAISK